MKAQLKLKKEEVQGSQSLLFVPLLEMTLKKPWKKRLSRESMKRFMGPIVRSKRHARWRMMKLINVESMSLAPRSLAGAHPRFSCRESGAIFGASQIYDNLLKAGKAKKICTACNRHLSDQEIVVFENYVRVFSLRMGYLQAHTPNSSKNK
jgi:hypothetical protein